MSDQSKQNSGSDSPRKSGSAAPKVIIAIAIILIIIAIVIAFVPGFFGWFDPYAG